MAGRLMGTFSTGWVERSDTHYLHFMKVMGFAGLNPSYVLDPTAAEELLTMRTPSASYVRKEAAE
jgi:hypothetical protein